MSAWNECPACGTAYDTPTAAARCCRGRGNSLHTWRRSSLCGASLTCVALADGGGRVLVRDTADPHGPVLAIEPAALAAALRTVTPCPNCGSVRAVRAVPHGRMRCGCGHRWEATR